MNLHTTYLYVNDLQNISQVSIEVNLRLEKVNEQNLSLLRKIWPVSLSQMSKRLAGGNLGYLAFLDDKPVHYAWTQRRGFHHIAPARKYIHIQAGDIWIYHCRTVDWARGKGIYPFILTQILEEAKRLTSISRTWIYTTNINIASQRGIEKAGFQLYGNLAPYSILNVRMPGVILHL